MTSYYRYLLNDGAELFTVVCLPENGGRFPTVIYRSPYVDAEELMSEDEICRAKTDEFAYWLEAGYAVVFQHCRGRGRSRAESGYRFRATA